MASAMPRRPGVSGVRVRILAARHQRSRVLLMSSRRIPVSPLDRRQALRHLGMGLGAIAAGGCLPEVGRCVEPKATPADAEPGSARALLGSVEAMVVLMFENRSFDHILGHLRNDPDYPAAARLDGLTGQEFNL